MVVLGFKLLVLGALRSKLCSYRWGDGKLVEEYDATVVAIHTDNPQIIG